MIGRDIDLVIDLGIHFGSDPGIGTEFGIGLGTDHETDLGTDHDLEFVGSDIDRCSLNTVIDPASLPSMAEVRLQLVVLTFVTFFMGSP